MIDYPTQAKTLEKIIQRVKEEVDKADINSSMGMFKQALAQNVQLAEEENLKTIPKKD